MFIDSHIHLSHKLYNQNFPYVDMSESGFCVSDEGSRELVISRMKDAGIGCVIEPAIDLASNELLLELCSRYSDYIYAAVGVHPTRTPQTPWKMRHRLDEYVKKERVVAVGELGLDYHYARLEQHRMKQKRWIKYQLKLADRMGLPLVLHIREADRDAIRILKRHKNKIHGGVCHCFGGPPDIARIYTEELGLCLGIGGTLLMKPEISENLEKTVKEIPLEYLMLETDGPYVKPQKPDGITGKKWTKARNTSLIIPAIAQRVAELKEIPVEEVERVTTENVKRVFGCVSVDEMHRDIMTSGNKKYLDRACGF